MENLYRLSDEELDDYILYLRWKLIRQRLSFLRPIGFALRACMVMFGLLWFMPTHPMSIPATVGGGLSVAIIWRAF